MNNYNPFYQPPEVPRPPESEQTGAMPVNNNYVTVNINIPAEAFAAGRNGPPAVANPAAFANVIGNHLIGSVFQYQLPLLNYWSHQAPPPLQPAPAGPNLQQRNSSLQGESNPLPPTEAALHLPPVVPFNIEEITLGGVTPVFHDFRYEEPNKQNYRYLPIPSANPPDGRGYRSMEEADSAVRYLFGLAGCGGKVRRTTGSIGSVGRDQHRKSFVCKDDSKCKVGLRVNRDKINGRYYVEGPAGL